MLMRNGLLSGWLADRSVEGMKSPVGVLVSPITEVRPHRDSLNCSLPWGCRKLLPSILRSSMPFGVKAEAFFHLTANFNYPLMCVLSVLMAPAMVIRYNMGWYEMLLIDVPLFFAATEIGRAHV